MKKQGPSDTASLPLSSPTGSSSVQVYHEYQKVAFKMHSANGHATETGSHNSRDHVKDRDGTGNMPDVISHSQEQTYSMKDKSVHRSSMLMMSSSSQAYSGPEDNYTETLTETSTLTFVDAHIMDDSADSLHGVGMVYLKEFVLIDDDDDGDMSLREKTVTDLSIVDGKAADLVCGRLLSTSSGSLSEYKEECLPPEASPNKDVQAPHEKRHCCFCTLL